VSARSRHYQRPCSTVGIETGKIDIAFDRAEPQELVENCGIGAQQTRANSERIIIRHSLAHMLKRRSTTPARCGGPDHPNLDRHSILSPMTAAQVTVSTAL